MGYNGPPKKQIAKPSAIPPKPPLTGAKQYLPIKQDTEEIHTDSLADLLWLWLLLTP